MIVDPHAAASISLHYLPHTIVTAVLTLLGWLGKKVGENLINQFKAEWNAMKTRIDGVAETTKTLVENHMQHVQNDLAALNQKQQIANEKSDRQIEIITEKSDKQIEVLTEISKGIAVLVDRGERKRRG